MNSLKILIIDDNPDDRYLYRRVLSKEESSAFDVVESDNGEDGVDLVQQVRPDCVLLDYSLPGRDGIEILKKLRTKIPFLPVVMLTGQGNETLAVKAIREGAQNYISKSDVAPENLRRVIRLAIEHAAMESRIADQKQSLELFTRALAHDLREPVRTIRTFLEIIETSELSFEKVAEYKQYIKESADRMALLIDSVYQLMRVDAYDNERSANHEGLVISCDASQALAMALTNLHTLIEETGAVISADTLPACKIRGDYLVRVLQNIIGNAIQYAGNHAKISVKCEIRANRVIISISDNGPGISPQYVNKLFQPFTKISGSHGNLGLGLSICKKMVESAAGTIQYENVEGGGAKFIISLMYDDRGTGNVETEQKVHWLGSKDQTNQLIANVLLIDDSLSDMELARYALLEEKHAVCHMRFSSDGYDALRMLSDNALKETPFDLVLLDINMPGIDGFETLEKIRGSSSFGSVPVIICTTSAYDGDRKKAQELGASGYIVKPLNVDVLKEAVKDVRGLAFIPQQDGERLCKIN